MFSGEHWQIKLAYAGFGALLLFIGMMLSPVTAQRDKFGEIECTGLTIFDEAGVARVRLGANEHGGGERGGHLDILDDNGRSLVSAYTNEYGGRVNLFGFKNTNMLLMGMNKEGVDLHVMKDILKGVTITVDEHGGVFNSIGNDGKSRVRLGIDRYGGVIKVQGKGEGAAVMGINEYGNGVVSTWDKNGYRQ